MLVKMMELCDKDNDVYIATDDLTILAKNAKVEFAIKKGDVLTLQDYGLIHEDGDRFRQRMGPRVIKCRNGIGVKVEECDEPEQTI